jgi:hypothetical protein
MTICAVDAVDVDGHSPPPLAENPPLPSARPARRERAPEAGDRENMPARSPCDRFSFSQTSARKEVVLLGKANALSGNCAGTASEGFVNLRTGSTDLCERIRDGCVTVDACGRAVLSFGFRDAPHGAEWWNLRGADQRIIWPPI